MSYWNWASFKLFTAFSESTFVLSTTVWASSWICLTFSRFSLVLSIFFVFNSRFTLASFKWACAVSRAFSDFAFSVLQLLTVWVNTSIVSEIWVTSWLAFTRLFSASAFAIFLAVTSAFAFDKFASAVALAVTFASTFASASFTACSAFWKFASASAFAVSASVFSKVAFVICSFNTFNVPLWLFNNVNADFNAASSFSVPPVWAFFTASSRALCWFDTSFNPDA